MSTKAILTKYIGPTSRRGLRIRASEPEGRSVMLDYSKELDSEGNHVAAASALCKRMGWSGKLISGWLGGVCFVHVFAALAEGKSE